MKTGSPLNSGSGKESELSRRCLRDGTIKEPYCMRASHVKPNGLMHVPFE